MTARRNIATKLRLASGLVLMAYACTHLINHTLGIHSLAAMEAGGRIFTAVWRAAPATLLLYAAFAIHIVLAVHKLWRRRSLKMPAWEMAQIVRGFLIPFWLAVHIIGTRGSHQFFGVDDTYGYVLNTLWPDSAYRHSFMLVLAWLHGCIGIHFWLRLRPPVSRLAAMAVRARAAPADARPDRLRRCRPRAERPRRERPGLARAAGRGAELARSIGDGVDLRNRAAGAARVHRDSARDPPRARLGGCGPATAAASGSTIRTV
jgi:hypothetical protein